ncbi:hypothetical protein EDD21DRAFT_152991 [Dissophora ornata]|nr:hypothetical protein BGZ58_007035 [Dissophora ornata]KAI8599720.1 hypothetical protein EDD21DRAFT_152991 [Dissophora ornata]
MLNDKDNSTSPSIAIPVIDFGLFTSDPEECARQIGEASQNIGFFYLKNHGISQDLIDEMFNCSERFFQQPLQNKSQHLIGPDNDGYTPMKAETLDPEHQTQGDLKEAYNVRKTSVDNDVTNCFVQGDKAGQEKVGIFFKDLHHLSRDIMQCFAIALQVPKTAGGRHFFDKSHEWDAESGTTLRFLHYPQQSGDPNSPLAGSHTDYGSITLLLQKDIAGLEVQASRVHKNVPWVAAPVIPDAILINIADHLQMWTNGLLKSTMHRVVYNPQQLHHSRFSIACFIHANDDTKLDPIPSPLITQGMRAEAVEFEEGRNMTAGEYLQWRLERTYNYDIKLDDA